MLHASASSPAATPHLSVQDLSCRRGTRRLFERLDLEIHPGQIVWVRGANGRGKTSLLRLVCGLARAQSGAVRHARATPTGSAQAGASLVYIGHANALKDELTVAESLAFLLRIHGRAADPASVDAALRRWGMASLAQSPVRALSQGQRRRVALARLAAEQQPALWVLDEPYDALDVEGTACLDALLAEHLRRAGCVLLTGHPGPWAAGLPLRELDLDRRAG